MLPKRAALLGASAWDATYATGVAKAATPEGPFEKRAEPILGTGPSGAFVGPGHGSQWVIAPNGKMYLPFRVQRRDAQGHFKPQILMLEELGFDGEWPGP